ncbi:RNA-directed DNA polymerase, eukaryota, reverse transcriptase zinc-binding domain protein [Tanacetum coccineum]
MSGRGGYYGSGVINENRGSEEELVAVNNGNKRNAKIKGTMSDGLKKNVETTNRFVALNKVIEEDNETEWQRLKHRIDLACEIKVPIPNKEMLSWLKDASKYYGQKLIEVEKNMKVNQFKNKVNSLERKIVKANKMVKGIAQDKVNSLVGERMKTSNMSRNQALGAFSLNVPLTNYDKDSWTEEMIEAYKGILEERGNDVINGHWEQNYNEAIEEVAEETSTHASFIVKNNVVNDGMTATSKQDKVKLLIRESNLLDSSRGRRIAVGWDPFILNATLLFQSDQVMYFLVSIISCQKEMFISFIYGENDPKDRVALWNNLRSHNEAIGESPWIQDFRRCIEVLDMEDLSMNDKLSNAYASFLPFVSSDHSLAMLTFLGVVGRKKSGFAMYILAKRLMMMKPYMRELNVKNVNVFDKVKFLREELKKVQRELDKDHGDAFLREEELLYYVAYKDAIIDEEKVLKQKSKIRWNGRMLGEINNTLISLIPKSKAPIKNKGRRCAFKVDIQKAYDTVNWDFLKFSLENFGFHAKMIKWIMECLSTASFLVSVNRESHGFFKAKRGLGQGDPISPYLFTIVMEVFSLMVDRQIQKEKGFKRPLDEFTLASSLYPSMEKSTVYFENVSNDIRCEILMVMPFKEATLPVRYLGVSLVAKKLCIKDCEILTDNVEKRLDDWKKKFLTFAGRLQLIASILCYLQAAGKDYVGKASVNWDKVCRPKSQGGLGLKSLHMWNEALMAKHLWNVISDKESIWQLLRLRDNIRRFVGVKLGDGKKCNIWFDRWHNNGPLCKLINYNVMFYYRLKKDAKVSDYIGDDGWKWTRDWNDRFMEVINVLVPALNSDIKDRAFWIDNKGKENKFSVNEVWKGIRNNVPKVIWNKHVWFSQCIPSHSFILWVAIKGRLKTHDRISKWLNIQDMNCVFCKIATDMWNLVLCNGNGKNIGLSMNDGS